MRLHVPRRPRGASPLALGTRCPAESGGHEIPPCFYANQAKRAPTQSPANVPQRECVARSAGCHNGFLRAAGLMHPGCFDLRQPVEIEFLRPHHHCMRVQVWMRFHIQPISWRQRRQWRTVSAATAMPCVAFRVVAMVVQLKKRHSLVSGKNARCRRHQARL